MPQEREGRSEGEGGGQNKRCGMRLKQNVKTNTGGRAGQRERESELRKCCPCLSLLVYISD